MDSFETINLCHIRESRRTAACAPAVSRHWITQRDVCFDGSHRKKAAHPGPKQEVSGASTLIKTLRKGCFCYVMVWRRWLASTVGKSASGLRADRWSNRIWIQIITFMQPWLVLNCFFCEHTPPSFSLKKQSIFWVIDCCLEHTERTSGYFSLADLKALKGKSHDVQAQRLGTKSLS